ncbi:LPS export ABC transporter periplasmic protein LptC [Pseudochrobactrum asaccharolyticum]|uniref:LPS export ABC transporter periplasmic protein LptC n=1 Tax=Pseudochrobactrum asaccharolyticum TaxID=354351 RepID=UPI00404229C9
MRVLKTALPVIALGVGAVFSWFTFLAAPASTVKVELDPSESGKLVMTGPQLKGYTNDKRPFSMIAERAVQDAKQNGVVALEGIKAQLPVGDKESAEIDAISGVYDSNKGRLQFNDAFTVKTTDGMEAKLGSALVIMSKGEMATNKPVDIRTENAHIRANKMRIKEGGKVMVFENDVHLTIQPVEEAAAVTKKGS